MAVPLTPNEELRYVLLEDRKLPPEQQTVFRLRRLSHALFAILYETATHAVAGTRGQVQLVGQRTYEIARWAIRGWSNLVDGDGREVPCDLAEGTIGGERHLLVTEASMEYLRLEWIVELASAAVGQSHVEALEGNG